MNPDGSAKMSDFNYYMFFALVMGGATVVFSLVARFYKGKTYLQSQELTEDESRDRTGARGRRADLTEASA